MDRRTSAGRRVEQEDHDHRWLDALVRRYTPALSRFFERHIEQKADVADLVQDVFLRLTRLRSAKLIAKPENYLFKTASNALRDHFRRGSVRQTHAHEQFDADKHGGSDFSPADVLEGREAVAALQAALRGLPERTRDVFVLKVFEEQKTADIALAMAISTRAVEKHYAKALERITRSMGSYRG